MNVSSDYAGVFGRSIGTIKNLIVAGTLISRANYVGGICGYAYNGNIQNCINNAAITGNNSVGSICGSIYKDSCIINCTNNAAITGGNIVGGICGDCDASLTRNCVNNGTVTGTSGIGGILD